MFISIRALGTSHKCCQAITLKGIYIHNTSQQQIEVFSYAICTCAVGLTVQVMRSRQNISLRILKLLTEQMNIDINTLNPNKKESKLMEVLKPPLYISAVMNLIIVIFFKKNVATLHRNRLCPVLNFKSDLS